MGKPDLVGNSPYGEWLGRVVLSVDEERRAIEVAYEAREEFANRAGSVSGGILSAMLDSLTGLVALAALPEGAFAVHTRLEVDYLRPARVGRLVGHARVTERDGDEIHCTGELIDADETVVARASAALRVVGRQGVA